MQTLQNAVMIILWHWDALKEKDGILSDKVDIENAQSCAIVRIDDSGSKDNIVKHIKKQLYIASGNNSKVLLLMHNNSLDRERFRKIEKLYPNANIDYFGGGKDYIYYNPVTDTGLLNEFNSFIENSLLKWEDPHTGEKKREFRNIVIPSDKSSDSFLIPYKYFHAVWQYYITQPKRKAFELKEKLFIYLVGNQFSELEKRELPVLLQQDQSGLGAFLSSFLDTTINTGSISEIYGKDDVVKAYQALHDFIKTTAVGSKNYLQQLRGHFSDLLQVMPEKIYG
jgi:hypothetical protein